MGNRQRSGRRGRLRTSNEASASLMKDGEPFRHDSSTNFLPSAMAVPVPSLPVEPDVEVATISKPANTLKRGLSGEARAQEKRSAQLKAIIKAFKKERLSHRKAKKVWRSNQRQFDKLLHRLAKKWHVDKRRTFEDIYHGCPFYSFPSASV